MTATAAGSPPGPTPRCARATQKSIERRTEGSRSCRGVVLSRPPCNTGTPVSPPSPLPPAVSPTAASAPSADAKWRDLSPSLPIWSFRTQPQLGEKSLFSFPRPSPLPPAVSPTAASAPFADAQWRDLSPSLPIWSFRTQPQLGEKSLFSFSLPPRPFPPLSSRPQRQRLSLTRSGGTSLPLSQSGHFEPSRSWVRNLSSLSLVTRRRSRSPVSTPSSATPCSATFAAKPAELSHRAPPQCEPPLQSP